MRAAPEPPAPAPASRVLAGALVVVATLLVWAPALRGSFTMDDFGLVLGARDDTLGDWLRTTTAGYFAREGGWIYWRPGWYLLAQLAWEPFGAAPAGWIALGIVLHAVVAWGVHRVVVRESGDVPLGVAAGVAFGAWPAGAEAVVWPSAALNVLPATLLLLAAAVALARWLATGERRAYAAALAAGLASYAFREAAHALVLLVPAAVLAAGRGRSGAGHCAAAPRRSLRTAVLATAPFAVAAVLHYVFLNRKRAIDSSLAETLETTVRNVGRIPAELTGLDLPGAVAWVAVALAVLAVGWARGATRFYLLWALAAWFPTVVKGMAPRFTYLTLAPAAIALALLLARAAGALPRATPLARRSVPLVLLALLSVHHALGVPAALAEPLRRGETCESVLASLAPLPLADGDRLVVDLVPPALLNGLADMLALHRGVDVDVETLFAVRRPPYLLVVNDGAWRSLSPGDPVLLYDHAGRSYRSTTRRELDETWIVAPAAQLVPRWTLAPSAGAAHERILAGEVDPVDTTQLQRDPGLDPPLGAAQEVENRIVGLARAEGGLSLEVECGTDCLLVLRYALDPERVRIAVDGAAAEVLSADGHFRAVPLRAGRHRVEIAGPVGL